MSHFIANISEPDRHRLIRWNRIVHDGGEEQPADATLPGPLPPKFREFFRAGPQPGCGHADEDGMEAEAKDHVMPGQQISAGDNQLLSVNSRPVQRRTPITMLGVPFDNITTAETRKLIAGMIQSGRTHYAATANVDFAVQALRDVELRRILAEAHLVLCDGMPLVWVSRLLGNPLPERVPGSGLVPLLLEDAEQNGWRVFFLGGTESSVALAAANTMARHPRLHLVGAYSPPFQPVLEMENSEILRRIQAARPHLLLVAFGCPKQEKWIHMHYRQTGVPLSIGVGATIDFLAGSVRRAPLWMQRTGTEWIFRMLQEPRRLVKRYSKDLVVFSAAILRQWWQLRSRQPLKPPAPAPLQPVRTRGATVAQAPERLDAAVVDQYLPAWESVLAREHLLLDLAETTFADSTGIGAITRLRKLARESDRSLVLVSPGARLRRTLELMKLTSLFDIADSLAEAHERVQSRAVLPVVAVQSGPEGIVLRWRGELTAATAPQIEELTLGNAVQLRPGALLKVILAGVPFADSTGVGLMIRLKKRQGQRGVQVDYTEPSPVVREVIRLTQLEEYLIGRRS